MIVNRKGRKYFLFRYTFNGAKRSMKLGDYPQMDVADARHHALDLRGRIAGGIDPQCESEAIVPANQTLKAFVTDDYRCSRTGALSRCRSTWRTHLTAMFASSFAFSLIGSSN
jgi:hypothetical protein